MAVLVSPRSVSMGLSLWESQVTVCEFTWENYRTGTQEATGVPDAREQSGHLWGSLCISRWGRRRGQAGRRGAFLPPEGLCSLCHFLLCLSDLTLVQQGRLDTLRVAGWHRGLRG